MFTEMFNNQIVNKMLRAALVAGGMTIAGSAWGQSRSQKQDARSPESIIEQVTVFADRAEITRGVDLACGPEAGGELSPLPPGIEAASLRASAGEATVETLELREVPMSEAFSPQLAKLDEQLRDLEAKLAEQRDAVERAHDQNRLTRRLSREGGEQIDREMMLGAPDLKTWGASWEQTLAAELKSDEAIGKAEATLRTLERQRDELEAKREQLGASSKRTQSAIRARVSCAPGGTAHLQVTYTLGGASWRPSYEARAEEPKKAGAAGADAGEPGAVGLSMFGTVAQTTGEDWSGAKLILSTALPRTDATPPELNPLYVYADKREPPKKVLVQREELRQHAEAAAGKGGLDSNDSLSSQFAVEERSEVKGDGTPARVLLSKQELPASFAWRVFPSAYPYVFRAADVVNTAPFTLLQGPVDLFRAHGLAGRAMLPRVASGAPFHLSFGLEERLKVKRLVMSELSQQTGVLKKGARYEFHYAYELQSLIDGPIALEVADRVPVSELDDVHVEIDPATSAGYALDPSDGMVRWKQQLSAKEKKRLELAFHVDVPGEYLP